MHGGHMGRGAALAATVMLGAVVLLAGTGPQAMAGRPKPTASPPAATGTIYASQRMAPAGSVAVNPDGTGLRPVDCSGDWQHRTTDRRVLIVESVAGETYPVATLNGLVQVPRQRLVTRDAACGDRQVVWEAPAGLWLDPATWSQDGSRIAVRAREYGTDGVMVDQGIWTGELDGSCGPGLCHPRLAVPFPMVQLLSGPGDVPIFGNLTATPRWSMDGRTVVYSRPPVDGSEGGELYLADLGAPGSMVTSAETRIPVAGTAVAPVFSPVDDRIAFLLVNRTSACRLNDLLITTRSGELQPVVAGSMLAACSIGGFDWSPDGAWLAFNATNKAASRDDIWTIRVGASKASVVLSNPGAYYWVNAWR